MEAELFYRLAKDAHAGSVGKVTHNRLFRGQVHRRLKHSLDFGEPLLDRGGACGAVHSSNGEYRLRRFFFRRNRPVPRLFNGGNDRILLERLLVHGQFFCGRVYRSLRHSGQFDDRPFHRRRARGAAHSGNCKCLFQVYLLRLLKSY